MTARVLVLGCGPLRERFFLTAARMGVETLLVEESAYSRYDRLADSAYAWRLSGGDRPGPDLGRLTGFAGRVRAVTALTDWAVPIAARLAHRWGLPGPGPAAAERGHDKSLVRAVLADGVRHRRVHTPAEAVAFCALTGAAAVVLKPLDGQAGAGVRLARGPIEAAAALPHVLAATGRQAALIEEYVAGPEYSFEAVIRSGRLIHLTRTDKISSGAPGFIELRHLTGGGRAGAAERDFVQSLAGALVIEDAVLHAEAKLTPAGWRLIELALRLAGGLIPDLVRDAHGIDLYEEQLRLALGMPARRAAEDPGAYAGVQYVAGRGKVADFPSMAAVFDGLDTIRSAERLLQPGTVVADVAANWWRAGYVSGASPDRERLTAHLAEAARRLTALLGLEPLQGSALDAA